MPWPNRRRAALAAALAGAIALTGCGASPDRPRRAGRPTAEGPAKVGRPYQAGGRTWVPADDRNYDRTGIASWYGAQFRGRPTATGERFDPDGISAAHTTLPLPSYADGDGTWRYGADDRGAHQRSRAVRAAGG